MSGEMKKEEGRMKKRFNWRAPSVGARALMFLVLQYL
jgi:hypothetical protein